MAFPTTLWSIVDTAKQSGDDSDAALGVLCETYWRPLYLFARRKGIADEDARDVVQAFFLKVIEKDYFAPADQSKGRFRTFLLTCFQRFLANEYKRDNAVKRGGRALRVDIDWQIDGSEIGELQSHDVPADVLFEREWAHALIARAIDRLQENEVAAGRGAVLETLGHGIFVGYPSVDHEAVSAELGMSKNALKVAVHRLRKRFRTMIEQEVRLTVGSDEEVEAELRHLLEAVSK